MFSQDNFPPDLRTSDGDQTKTNEPKLSQVKKKVDQVFTNQSFDDLRAGDFDFVLDEGKFEHTSL